MRLRLPSISPCARAGFVVWGSVLILVALLLWLSAYLTSDTSGSIVTGQDGGGPVRHAVSQTDTR